MKTQIDHLVVLAKTLEQGVQWCQATLGVTPAPGGEHSQYGTHNRLFKIATPANPYAYLEIIAIDPTAKGPAQGQRWFDMDDATLQAAVAQEPRLIHFVANTDELQAARIALKQLDLERGPAVHAKRHTRKGVLHWQITVREDGQRLFNGALPSLIQWGKADETEPMRLHPRNSLPRSGVSLQSLAISHPSSDKLVAAYAAIGLEGVAVQAGPAQITAELRTPKGVVVLQSLGI
jgi:Glyoxalase-like domain